MDIQANFNKWFSDQQVLIDQGDGDLKQATATIGTLNQKITDLTNQIATLNATAITTSAQLQAQNTQLAANLKTIADLQAQVKALTPVVTPPVVTGKPFGVNTHPSAGNIYKDTATTVAKVNDLGMNVTRSNFAVDGKGNMDDAAFNAVLAAYGKVQIQAMLSSVGLNTAASTDADLKTQYNNAFAMAKNFGTKYGKKFMAIEIGNEMATKCILNASVSGQNVADYDPVKIKAVGNFMKGMSDGLRAADPKIQIIVDGTWIHFAFISELINTYKVDFDILAWHWYTDQEISRKKANANAEDIEVTVKNKFPDYPLWFNEVGYRYNSSITDTDDQMVTVFLPLIQRLKSRVDGLILYELFDEAERAPTNKVESRFGLYNADLTPKKIVAAIKGLK